MDARKLLTRAIAMYGSEAKLGAACGLSQAAINKAKIAGRISPTMAVAIEKATDRRITRSELRPDLWPAPVEIARQAI